MKALTKILAAGLLMLGLAACNKAPTLDASTPETLKESSKQLRAKLTPEQADRFDSAVTLVIAATLDPMETLDLAVAGTMPTHAGVFERIKPAFDGKTYDDIVSDGASSAAKVRANLATWKAKQGELRGRYNRYVTGMQQVTSFSPVAADLKPIASAIPLFGDNQVVVTATFKNTLSKPVKAVQLMVGLAPPGVSSPWVREAIQHTFDAPVAPGAQAIVTTRPIAVMIPQSYKGPVQLEAMFDVTRLDFVGAPPVLVPDWSEDNQMMIAKLETSITQIESLLRTIEPVKT